MSANKNAEITQIYERNQEATLYVGNLDTQVDESLLWELFVQCGPVRNVHIPRDKITSQHSSYGFVEFESEIDAEYALKILNMIKMYGKPIRCNKASQDRRIQEIGANLFVGNLDNDVDEKLLFDTFSAFGAVISAKVMRDPDNALSKGFGFVSFDSFEASDACLAAMNGQFLCNRPIHVSYAYKKDTKGERHGSAAERLIAANRPATEKPKLMSGIFSIPSANVDVAPLPFSSGVNMLPPLPPPPVTNGFPIPPQYQPRGASPPVPGTQASPPPVSTPALEGSRPPPAGKPAPASSFPPPPGLPVRSPSFPGVPPVGMVPMPGMMNMNPPNRFPSIPAPNAFPGLPHGLPPPPMFFPARPGFALPVGMPPLPSNLPGGVPPPAPVMNTPRP